MKVYKRVLLLLIITVILSSCGAIPTLPPLDSTVIIRTPNITAIAPRVTSTDVGLGFTLEPNTPAATSTADSLPPSETVFPSPTDVDPTSTPTPGATATSTATPTATATSTPDPTFTPTPVPYTLQLMNPYYLTNFTHVDLGCDWMGVAGQIFDKDGLVQKVILIKAGGDILGTPIVEEMTMPLAESEIDLAYGPGGYELTLANSPADTEDTIWIQLYNLAGDPLSEKIYLTTYDDCLKNLILMNFIEQ